MAGKKQHDLSCLLLKGFASRREDDKFFAWQFRKDAPPPNEDVSVRDVRPSKNFYGKPGAGTLDDIITLEVEPRHTEFLIRVRRDCIIHSLTEEEIIIDLVHSVVVRTKNFRDRVENVSHAALDKFQPIFTDPDKARRWLISEVRNGSSSGDQFLTKYVELRYGEKAGTRKYFKWSKRGEFARWLHTPSSEEILQEMTTAAKPQFSDLKNQIPELVKTTHNDVLKKAFQSNDEESPRYKRYQQMRWKVQIVEGEPLMLGDIAVLQYKQKTGEFSAAYDGISGDVILFPISPRLLIVGVLENTESLPSSAEINYYSAVLSVHYFVSSQNTEREREYQKIIGNIALQVPKT